MSSWKNGYYSIIQYCPDRSRMEAANVGVLLFCPDIQFLEVTTAPGNDRIRRFFGTKNVDLAVVEIAKRAMQARVRSSRAAFEVLEDLVTFIESRANQLRLTPPRPVKVNALEPSLTLQELFNELVGGREKREPLAKSYPQLDRLFRNPHLAGRVRFNETVRIPVLERNLTAPYAFTNGRVNLVLPERFTGSDIHATNKALRLAAEGGLLWKHADTRLIVPSKFEETVGARNRILEVFRDYDVKALDLSNPTELALLADEVERTAHS